MGTTWIDYRELKRSLDLAFVLTHYDVAWKRKGDQAQAQCPLPGHEPNGSDKKGKPSFSANLARGVWKCFGCGRSGNVLELIALLEGLDPENRDEFRKAARLAQEAFLPQEKLREAKRCRDSEPSAPRVGTTRQRPEETTARSKPAERPHARLREVQAPPAEEKRVLVNPPLDFALKELDPEHPFLTQDLRLSPETITHFGLGYCNRGLMKGRIAIPLHDFDRRLVGYIGRLTKERDASAKRPLHVLPSTRERDGVVHEFRKDRLLYHAHAVKGGVEELVVVERLTTVWRLFELGHTHVVGLIGSDCSPEQAEQIVGVTRRGGIVYVLTENDAVGEQCALSVLRHVAPHRNCRWVRPDGETQLSDVLADDLHRLIAGWSDR